VIGEIVIAIADEDHHTAHDVGLVSWRTRRIAQLLHASLIDGVVHRGAAAGTGLIDLIAEQATVTGERLDDLRFIIKSHRESLVFTPAQYAIEEVHGGFLLKLDAIANAVGCVQKNSDAERKIGLFAEEANFLGNIFVGNLESFLIEIRNQPIAPVKYSR
jgi:hypothetical protein